MAATAGTVQSSRGHLSMDVSDSHIEVSFVQSDWSLPDYFDINFIIQKKKLNKHEPKTKPLHSQNLKQSNDIILYCNFGDGILIKQY